MSVERENGELSERDYEALHADYTARAAIVLRALERGPARAARADKRETRVRTKRPLVVTLGVVVLVAALAGGAVATFAGQRGAGSPITGSLPDSPSGKMQQALELEAQGKAADALKVYDAMLKELMTIYATHPTLNLPPAP